MAGYRLHARREEPVLEAVAEEVRASAHAWFPELDQRRARLVLVRREDRPRCFLYWTRLEDGSYSRSLLVKVRHSLPGLRRADRYEGDRPVLTPERTLPDYDTALRECEGLRFIASLFGPLVGERFGVLPVLAWVPQHAAIVMERVSEPTLRGRLMGSTQLRPHLGRREPDLRAWTNAGAWLRIYHQAAPDLSLLTRTARRDDVLPLFGRYADFLGGVVADPELFARIEGVGAVRGRVVLPEQLPLGTGHGDYTPRNLFVSSTGRVTAFDPMPLWRVPVFEDVARFVVNVRLLGIQAVSQGRAFRADHLDLFEDAFLHGYFGEDVPDEAVRLYELLVLLDKWAALVSKEARGRGAHRQVRRHRVQLSNRYFRREGRRLLAQIEATRADRSPSRPDLGPAT